MQRTCRAIAPVYSIRQPINYYTHTSYTHRRYKVYAQPRSHIHAVVMAIGVCLGFRQKVIFIYVWYPGEKTIKEIILTLFFYLGTI